MPAIAEPRERDQKPTLSIVPYGTDIRFLHHVPALRTGLLSLCPYGTPTRRHADTPTRR
jgi:hypothetical protein